ncbi:MAG: tetratricopeptide repeat protein [Elusimicrobiota bacterium]|nr:tetratricopeptide repeat protein [Elusimicrobiota bacterium]
MNYRIAIIIFLFFPSPIPTFAAESAKQYCNQGDSSLLSSEWDKAIEAYSKAILLDKSGECGSNEKGYAYYYRAYVYLLTKKYREAIVNDCKAIELNPGNFNAYKHRGFAYYSVKEYTKAIADFDKAIKLDPNNYDAAFLRGDAYAAIKRYQEAIKDYTVTLTKIFPNIHQRFGYNFHELEDVYSKRGNTYCAIGEYNNAIKDYDEALKLNPDNSSAREARAVAWKKAAEIHAKSAAIPSQTSLPLKKDERLFQGLIVLVIIHIVLIVVIIIVFRRKTKTHQFGKKSKLWWL